MTITEILWEAKHRIETGKNAYCCFAISDQINVPEAEWVAAQEFFQNMMWSGPGYAIWWNGMKTPERQKLRAEALELAALSAEREALYKEKHQ